MGCRCNVIIFVSPLKVRLWKILSQGAKSAVFFWRRTTAFITGGWFENYSFGSWRLRSVDYFLIFVSDRWETRDETVAIVPWGNARDRHRLFCAEREQRRCKAGLAALLCLRCCRAPRERCRHRQSSSRSGVPRVASFCSQGGGGKAGRRSLRRACGAGRPSVCGWMESGPGVSPGPQTHPATQHWVPF